MNSNLKIVLALILLAVFVFGVTVISTYTSRPPEESTDPNAPGNSAVTEPLKHSINHIYFDPLNEEPEFRLFQGFFEPGDTIHWAGFWLMNVNPVPIEITASGRSCTACTSARIAVIPGEKVPEYQALNRAAAVVALTGAPDLLGALAGAKFYSDTTANWLPLVFENPSAIVTIPAGSVEKPTYALLQIGFKVLAPGPRSISALIGMRATSMPNPIQTEFKVSFVGMPPFEVNPKSVDLGDFPENAEPRSAEIVFWSATRTLAELPAPIGNANDPFVELGKPIVLTQPELDGLSLANSGQNSPLRILSGYKFRVLMHRHDPKPEPGKPPRVLDIGPSEKIISLTTSGAGATESKGVTLKVNVTGAVSLVSGGKFDLGDFNGRNGITKTDEIVSENPQLDLEFLPDQTTPRFLNVIVGEPRVEGGRKFWPVKVNVRANEGLGELPSTSVLAFKVKGSSQLIKIPVRGRGYLR